MIHRPLVVLSLAGIAGTAIGLNREVPVAPLAFLIATSAIFTTIAGWVTHEKKGSHALNVAALIAASVAMAGIAAIHANTRPDAVCDISTSLPAGPVEITGMIIDDPVVTREFKWGEQWSFRARITNSSSSACAPLEISMYQAAHREPPAYGDTWSFGGDLRRHVYQRRDGHQHTNTVVNAMGSTSQRIARGGGTPVLRAVYGGRRMASDLLCHDIQDRPEARRIINSLLLGYRRQMDPAMYKAFAATGTVHIFAISGSHVVVLAGIVIVGLMAMGIQRPSWFFFLAPILIGFTAATGMQPSAVRACIMALIFWGAVRLNRTGDIFCALALSAMAILAWDPANLKDLGFILSFVAVFGLAILYPPLAARWAPRAEGDHFELPKPAPWHRHWRDEIMKLLASSTAAWFVSTPLTAYYFNMFSLVALIGNMVVIPLAFLIMVAGSLSLLVGMVWLWPAAILNHANALLAELMADSMRVLATLPGGHWEVDSPAPLILVMYYVLLAWSARKLAVKTS